MSTASQPDLTGKRLVVASIEFWHPAGYRAGAVCAGGEDLHPQAHYIVDGTLLPCWSWASHPELYSGKHKTTGLNVQVACTLTGDLAWISDPIDGSRHDTYCLNESGVVADEPSNWIGDKGTFTQTISTVIALHFLQTGP